HREPHMHAFAAFGVPLLVMSPYGVRAGQKFAGSSLSVVVSLVGSSCFDTPEVTDGHVITSSTLVPSLTSTLPLVSTRLTLNVASREGSMPFCAGSFERANRP